MSIKLTFVFGLLLASGWTQEQILEPEKLLEPEKVSEPEKVLVHVKESSVDAKAEVNLGNEKTDDENMNKDVDENVMKNENGIKASASASAKFNFNFEEFIAKLFEAFEQNKENNNEGKSNENKINEEVENKKEEKNKEAEDNVQSAENEVKDEKSPFINSYNVHARASASSSSSSSSSFYFNFNDPLEDKKSNENENAEIQDENTGAPQENDDIVDDLQENFGENEQPIDVENVEVPDHCNQQNSKHKEPLVEEPLKTKESEDETKVEEVEQ